MTIDELISILEDYKEDGLDGDTEVRLMVQQGWPFENSIHGLCSSIQINEEAEQRRRDRDGDDYNPDDYDAEIDDDEPVLFIVDGGQLGYGSEIAWNAGREC